MVSRHVEDVEERRAFYHAKGDSSFINSSEKLKVEAGVLTQILMLNDTNYDHWGMRLRVNLEAKRLLKIIQGLLKLTKGWSCAFNDP